MKKQAVFCGSNPHALATVYTPGIRAKLAEHVQICDVAIAAEADVPANAEALKEVEYIFATWGMLNLGEACIRAYLPRLKAVFYAAGSVQYFAQPFLHCGVHVASAAAANAEAVAEYALAQILLANKGFLQASAMTKTDYRVADEYVRTFPGNYGARVGILGVGAIGTRVVELLQPFRLEVWAYDPFLTVEKAERLGVHQTDLADIFVHCQTISNHLADKPETEGLLHKDLFRLLGPNATFINTGRGRQVVEMDLAAALREVPTRTAILDVTVHEPPERDSPLLTLPNVFLTPHMAGSLNREFERMAEYMVEELCRLERGEELRFGVTLEMLQRMA